MWYITINTESLCIHTGVQLLSPSEMALVCPGQPLSLTCCANQSTTLRWIILLPHINDPYVQNVITIGDGSIPLIELEVAGRPIALNFLRQSTNPLTSMLSINNTVTGLNGTRINCSTGDSSEMTIIHIIGRKNCSKNSELRLNYKDLRFLLI